MGLSPDIVTNITPYLSTYMNKLGLSKMSQARLIVFSCLSIVGWIPLP